MGSSPPNKSFFSQSEDEPCSERCRSKRHGQKIWEIAQGGNEDSQVVCLWAKTCCNYSQVKDEFGRTALHAAATTGNLKAVEWLLKTQQCNVNAKDAISGYTALHRSIFFGHIHIARSLIKHGADINLRDHEGLTALELCQMERLTEFKHNAGDMTELTVWGSNANYNLGVGHQQPRLHPDTAPEFRRTEMSLFKVEMNTYHTLFLTQSGRIYACGYGMGGRLGTGDEVTVLSPKLVHLRNNGPCRDIAIGQDHSIFLTDSKVWTVGSNEFGQLGHTGLQTNKLYNPRTVDSLQKYGITGILAGPNHSVFYNSRNVLVCGQNQGQFGRGFEDGANVLAPAKLKLSLDNVGNGLITTVGGNEFCTAVCVDKQYIFLLRRNQYSRIDSRSTSTQEIVKVQASGEKNSITLFMLASSGRVLVWRENFNRATNESKGAFTRLVFSISRLLDVKDFSVSLSSLVVVTSTGEAYKGGWNCNNPPSIVGTLDERYGQVADADFQVAVRQRRGKREYKAPPMALELMKVKRVPNVHTGLSVSSDPKGNNFSILQRHQMMDITDIPILNSPTYPPTVANDIAKLYEEMVEDDSIHDVVFDLDDFHQFPAHRFIVAAASPVIAKILQNNITCQKFKVTNKLFGVDPAKCSSLENTTVFRAIMDLIYKRNCSFTSVGRMLEILDSCKTNGKRNSSVYAEKLKEISRFRNLCRHLGLEATDSIMQGFMSELENQWEVSFSDASNYNEQYDYIECKMIKHAESMGDMQFQLDENNPFLDVALESNDKIVFHAHKCILVARLNYFKTMFSTNWSCHEFLQLNSTQATKLVVPFSSKALSILLECVYTHKSGLLKEADYELLLETVACSDYMMNDRLMQMAEIEMVRYITLKNVADILAFTWKHNGSQLRDTCFQFISLNLTAMLENRLLDSLPVEIVKEMSSYYRGIKLGNLPTSRELEKCSGVPDSQDYLDAIKTTPEEILEQLEMIVETDESMILKKTPGKAPRSRVRLRSRTFSESESAVECPEEPSSCSGVRGENLRLSCSSNFDDRISSPLSPPYLYDTTPPVTPVAPEKEKKLIVPLPKNVFRVATPPKCIQGSSLRYDEFPTLGASATASSPPAQPILTKSVTAVASSPSEKTQHLAKSAMSSQALVAASVSTPQSQNQTPSSHGKKKTKWRTINSPAEVLAKPTQALNTSGICYPSLEHQNQLTQDGRDRNNPWKVNTKTNQVVFKAIVEDEVEKKRNFEKATSKPLPMMQIEDEAINFITQRYTSEDTEDFIELLTVERVVTSNFSTPMWVQHPGAVTASPTTQHL